MISRGRARGERLIRARLATPGVELDLEERGAPPSTTGAHDRLVGPGAHQRRVGGDAVRGQPREVVDRLDQVGLALAVAADERRRPGSSATSRSA